MKALGIALVALLAVAGGVAAATYITKKKLDEENDEEYFDSWEDDEDWDDDDDIDLAYSIDEPAEEASKPVEVGDPVDKTDFSVFEEGEESEDDGEL